VTNDESGGTSVLNLDLASAADGGAVSGAAAPKRT